MRMRRSVRGETRLAVIVATAPLTKRMRALAMSSCWLATAAPTASTLSIWLATSDRIRSRSWIIRSRITDTSVPRGLNGAMRVASIYSGAPSRPASAAKAAEKRSRWPTCSTRPASRRVAARSSACGERRGDRLLHQHMLAGAQRGGGKRMVCLGRCRDDQRVGGSQQRREAQVGRADFPADRPWRVRRRDRDTPTSVARSDAATFSAW